MAEGYHLLRKPHGFESFSAIKEHLSSCDAPVLKRQDVRCANLDRRSALPGGSGYAEELTKRRFSPPPHASRCNASCVRPLAALAGQRMPIHKRAFGSQGSLTPAGAAGAVASVLLNRGIYAPFQRRGSAPITLVIVSLGMTLIIEFGLQAIVGGTSVSYTMSQGPTVKAGGLVLTTVQLVIIGLSVVMMAGVHGLLRYSKLGKVRFTSHRDGARLWERALRKADVPIAMSVGFTPRPKLSFGLALPTSAESLAERPARTCSWW